MSTNQTVSWRRDGARFIEWCLVERGDDARWWFHCNRVATFHGSTAIDAEGRQVMGAAGSVWRANDWEVTVALKRLYPGAAVRKIVAERPAKARHGSDARDFAP